ncbi:MAG: hypothetical protein ACXWMX_02685, partial [Candidatus Limnocylindrales bacterium]
MQGFLQGPAMASPAGSKVVHRLVRTYTRLDGLVPAIYPDDASSILAFPIAWEVLQKDTPPNISSVPESQRIDLEASGLTQSYTPP